MFDEPLAPILPSLVMRLQIQSVFITLLLATQALSFSFKFYKNSGCRDELPDKSEVYGPDGGDDPDNPGCIHSHNKDGARGVIVSSTGRVDNKFGVRFFNNEDCDPSGSNTMWVPKSL